MCLGEQLGSTAWKFQGLQRAHHPLPPLLSPCLPKSSLLDQMQSHSPLVADFAPDSSLSLLFLDTKICTYSLPSPRQLGFLFFVSEYVMIKMGRFQYSLGLKQREFSYLKLVNFCHSNVQIFLKL